MLGQVPPKLLSHAFLRVDVAIDRLLADALIGAVEDKAVADLLWGPAAFDTVHDLLAQLGMPDEFSLASTSLGGLLMRGSAIVAVIPRHAFIAEPVPLDFTVDRGFRAFQYTRHLANRGLNQSPALDLHAFLDAQLIVNRSHGNVSPLDSSLFSNGSRT